MRRLDVHVPAGDAFDLALSVIKAEDPVDLFVYHPEQQDRRLITVFLREGTGQRVMDNLQTCLESHKNWRLMMTEIEATAPKLEPPGEEVRRDRERATREEIYSDVSKGTRIGIDFIVLVVLSTIVAAIGLNTDGVAAVIGAMVIAPLLGPILGFSFGVALGDFRMLKESAFTLAVGIGVALLSSLVISFVLPINLESRELMTRAEVRLDGLALAMAAGGAAALSVTRGQASALVGVMVAAALLPPGAAVGLFTGAGEWALALRAAMLLTLNVVALVLAAQIVFRVKRIRPRRWIEQKDADTASRINFAVLALLLAAMAGLIVYLDLGAKIEIG